VSQEINLINPALLPRRDWLGFRSVAILAGLVSLLMIGMYTYAHFLATSARSAQVATQAKLSVLQKDLQSIQATLAARIPNPALEEESLQLAAALKQRREVLQLAENLASRENGVVSEIMRGFSRQRMEGVWLTGFSFGPDGLDIRGRLLDPALLPAYIRRLNGEGAFRGRTFAALDMQSVAPEAGSVVASRTGQAESVAGAKTNGVEIGGPAHFTEFALRTSLGTSSLAGAKK